jgi:hypothetical protein
VNLGTKTTQQKHHKHQIHNRPPQYQKQKQTTETPSRKTVGDKSFSKSKFLVRRNLERGNLEEGFV